MKKLQRSTSLVLVLAMVFTALIHLFIPQTLAATNSVFQSASIHSGTAAGASGSQTAPLQIVYSNPVVTANVYSTATVSFYVYGAINSVTANVYAKTVRAPEYTVHQATYRSSNGLYSADIHVDAGNVQYYIEAADSLGRTTKTPVYNIEVQKYSNVSAKIAVFSDDHYYATELGVEGKAFEAYLAQDRKLIAESKAITTEAVDEIANSDANIVLVTGDLTKDGEKLSHEQFAALARKMEDAGKKVYVVPGNHDVNNPQANRYSGDDAIRVDNVTPEQFKNIYNDFGYAEAIAKDPNSLSYVAEPVPGLWILAMDSCLYDENAAKGHSVTAGAFSQERLDWIKEQLKKAQGKTVIGMMHHGMLEHYNGQKQFFGEYVIDNWEEVSTELTDLGLSVVFTGHYHANDISKKTTNAGNTIYDIETGSLVTYPSPYRMAELSNGKITVTTNRVENIQYNTGDKSYSEYAKNYLVTGLNGLVPYMLAEQVRMMNPKLTGEQAFQQAQQLAELKPAPTVISMTVKDLLVDAMVSHYQGGEKVSPQVTAVVQGMAQSPDPMSSMLGSFLGGLYTDKEPADTGIAIDLATSSSINLSSIADLSDIQINGNGLAGFDPLKQQYSVNVNNWVSSIQLTAALSDPNASVTITGNGVTAGAIPLNEGVNTISISVKAQDGTHKLYTLTVIRASRSHSGSLQSSGSSSENNGNVQSSEPKADSKGIAGVSIDQSTIDKAVQNAKDKKMVIHVPNVPESDKIFVTLPAAALQNAKDSNIEAIELQTELASIVLTPGVLNGKKTSSSSNVEVSVEKVNDTELSEDVRKKVNGKPVYDFAIAVDGQQVHSFADDRAVQITVDYPLAAGENPDRIVVFYVNEGVNPAVLEAVPGIYDAGTGKVTFHVNHFSKYIAMHVDVSFIDEGEAAWAKTYIEALAARNIISGIEDKRFAPNDNITRAQFMKMLISAFGLEDKFATASFTDVQPGTWYYSAVATAQKLGITNGMDDGSFGLNKQITRQEMAAMAYRTARIANLKLPKTTEQMKFADGKNIAPYADEAVKAMQQSGIINGVDDGRFAPDDHATRAQAAKILYEMYKLLNRPGRAD